MSVNNNIALITKAKGLSLRQLSNMTGIKYNTLYAAVKRNTCTKEETINKICKVLNCDPGILYDDSAVERIVSRHVSLFDEIKSSETQNTSKTFQVETDLGTLIAEVKDTNMWNSIRVSLKLKSGEVLPLSNTAVTKRCKDIVMELWQNPDSDIPEYRYLLPKEKLFPEQKNVCREEVV